MTDMLAGITAEGIDPAEVARMVVDAVRAEQFLLLAHPHHADARGERAARLATGALPEGGDLT